MSEKMKMIFNKPIKKKKIMEVMDIKKTKINNLLNESIKITTKDKEELYHYINQPGNKIFILSSYEDIYEEKDRRVVISRKSGNMVTVMFLSEFVEFQDILIEMCDKMSWSFKSGLSGEYIVFEIFPM